MYISFVIGHLIINHLRKESTGYLFHTLASFSPRYYFCLTNEQKVLSSWTKSLLHKKKFFYALMWNYPYLYPQKHNFSCSFSSFSRLLCCHYIPRAYYFTNTFILFVSSHLNFHANGKIFFPFFSEKFLFLTLIRKENHFYFKEPYQWRHTVLYRVTS